MVNLCALEISTSKKNTAREKKLNKRPSTRKCASKRTDDLRRRCRNACSRTRTSCLYCDPSLACDRKYHSRERRQRRSNCRWNREACTDHSSIQANKWRSNLQKALELRSFAAFFDCSMSFSKSDAMQNKCSFFA